MVSSTCRASGVTIVAVCLIVSVYSSIADRTVTLSHGGQLKGLGTTFQDSPVDLFLGIRYAQPPTGNLRFKRPEQVPAWKGVVEATTFGHKCPQPNLQDGTADGDEDCLFMDITVPGGVTAGAKKPVMVWIHGGACIVGSGTSYIGAPLAVTGDVIVVSINYRLGTLGFLIAGKGTGNFGLWDQRAALLWVRQNIEQFGGDPDLVTIFGESAGGASVSCHTVGQHTDGLFKRAITQSGTCFMSLSQSENTKYKLAAAIRERTNCSSDRGIYDCFRHMTGEQVLNLQLMDVGFMMPNEDGDFFSEQTTKEESYQLSHRFDYMGGMNGQEGGLFYGADLTQFARSTHNKSVEEGVDMELVDSYLTMKCSTSQFTPLSPHLCVDFIINTYKLDEAADDKERAVRLTAFLGEQTFDAETINQLEQHSSSDKSTYAYYFTEPYKYPNPLWTLPSWLRTKADHGDEIGPLFGAPFVKAAIEKNALWKDLISTDKVLEGFLIHETDFSTEEQDFSRLLMTAWTNFAISGDPNRPVALPSGSPAWPEFNTHTNVFMELKLQEIKVITTPNRERVTKVRLSLNSARKLQIQADQAPNNADSAENEGSSHDEL